MAWRRVTTVHGYVFESDQVPNHRPTLRTRVPKPELKEFSKIPLAKRNFAATFVGHQQEWPEKTLIRKGFPDGLKKLPDEFLQMTDGQIKNFLIKVYDIGAYLNVHWPSKDAEFGVPEIWFHCKEEQMARQIQYMWLRLNVRTKVWYAKQRKMWQVSSAGKNAYIESRQYLLKMTNPKIKERRKILDQQIPFDYRLHKKIHITDRIKEVEDLGDGPPTLENTTVVGL